MRHIIAGFLTSSLILIALAACLDAGARPAVAQQSSITYDPPSGPRKCCAWWGPECHRVLNYNSALERDADDRGRLSMHSRGVRRICEQTVPDGYCLILTRWRAWGADGGDTCDAMLVAETPDGRLEPRLLPENFSAFTNPVTGLKFPAGTRVALVGVRDCEIGFQTEGYLQPVTQ